MIMLSVVRFAHIANKVDLERCDLPDFLVHWDSQSKDQLASRMDLSRNLACIIVSQNVSRVIEAVTEIATEMIHIGPAYCHLQCQSQSHDWFQFKNLTAIRIKIMIFSGFSKNYFYAAADKPEHVRICWLKWQAQSGCAEARTI